MPKPTKILHIITNLPVGGAQDNTLITVGELIRKNYTVSLMCAPDGPWIHRASRIAELEIIFIKHLTTPINLLKDVASFWLIYREIRRGRFLIVHTHSSKPGFLGRLAAWVAGVPIIIHTIHGFPFHDFMSPVLYKFFVMIERTLAYFTDILVTVSKLNLDKAVNLKIAPRNKFVNIYSGIDFRKFDAAVDVASKRRELGISNGEAVIGMIGRLSQQKAPWNLIQAIPGVLEHHRDVVFVIVGDGELMDRMKDLARKLQVIEQVRFLGFREDIAEILKSLDIFVLTSQWEGLGRSLTEAMYVGCAVIATGVEGVPELVRNRETGILVPVNDPEALSMEIVALLTDPAERQRLAENGKKRIDQGFYAQNMVAELDLLYRRIQSEVRPRF